MTKLLLRLAQFSRDTVDMSVLSLSHPALGTKRVGRSPLKSMAIAMEARRDLGLTGTTEPSIDPEDPDSDIPDKLQVIIACQSDDESIRNLNDTPSFHRPSEPSSLVPEETAIEVSPVDLVPDVEVPPVFRAQVIDEADNQAALDDDVIS